MLAPREGAAKRGKAVLSCSIFVINLREADERRSRILAHLTTLGLEEVVVVEAIRGDVLAPEERRRRADDVRSVSRYGRALTPGELGCAMSHARAYDLFLGGQEAFALILEDDAVLLPDVRSLLGTEELLRWMAHPEPRLLLMTPIRAFMERGAQPFVGAYRLVKVRRAWEGYGYLVNRAAARAMLALNSPAWLSADDWVAYSRLGGVEVSGLDPFCIGYLKTAPSQLEHDRRRAETRMRRARTFRARMEKWGRQIMDALYYRPVYGLTQHRMPESWPDKRA